MPPKQLSNSPNRHPVWLGKTGEVYRPHSYYTDLNLGELLGCNQLKVRNEPSCEKAIIEVKKTFFLLSSAETKIYHAHKYKNTIKEMFMARINY